MQLPDDVQIRRGQGSRGADSWWIQTSDGTYVGGQTDTGEWSFAPQPGERAAPGGRTGSGWQAPAAPDEDEASEVYRQFRLWQVEREDPHPHPREDEVM